MKPGMPPYAEFLGVTVREGEDGTPLFVLPFGDTVLGRPGFLHGGALAGLLELTAIGTLMHALADAGDVRVKPINVTVDFMRGGRDKPTYARGVVTRLGTRVANVETTAWQDDPARPIAAARMNYLVVRG